jgi:glycosyltransferase involved in cell wall biosynthesis
VLPVRNGGRYLAEAVGSVLQQQGVSLELIVVDDRSTDDSLAIAQAWQLRDDRVRILAATTSGLVAALNAGTAAAAGEFIARMDADDVAMPRRFSAQVAYLDEHPGSVAVGSGTERIDEQGRLLGLMRYPTEPERVTAALLAGDPVMCHPTMVMRRETLLEVGGYRAEQFPSEDVDLLLRLEAAGALANLAEPLLRYRIHREAVSIRQRSRQFDKQLSLLTSARQHRGLSPLRRRDLTSLLGPAASYHFLCARVALLSGRDGLARTHAVAGARSQPWMPHCYLLWLACVLPNRWLLRLVTTYRALQQR